MIIAVLIIAAILGGALFAILRPHPQPPAADRHGRRYGTTAQPMPVVAVNTTKGDMPIVYDALGAVTPLATVTVRTQIAGQLVRLGFEEGQAIEKGAFLAQVDPRPYQIQLEQAQAQLARDNALLKNAQIDLARYRKLVEEDSIARQQLDTQQSLVRQYEGTVKADQAAVDTAKLDLIYCRITAPISGRVGLRQVDVGNYIQTGDTNGIVVITQMGPISVIFTLPEDRLQAVRKRLKAGATLPVAAFDRSGQTKLAEGVLTTVDNQIDMSTGTVKLRAEFANEDESLFPNQFVNAELLVDTQRDVTLLPAAAVQRGAQGTFVYRVQPDQTVAVQPITLGATDGKHIVVTAGLEPGTPVVTDGADKLRDGAKVAQPAAAIAHGKNSHGSEDAGASAENTPADSGRQTETATEPASSKPGQGHRRQRNGS